MKHLFILFISLAIGSQALMAQATPNRTGPTKINSIVINAKGVEIYTAKAAGCGTNKRRWLLPITHVNYNALYSGFLSSKINGREVEIVGKGQCANGDIEEIISWAYVAI